MRMSQTQTATSTVPGLAGPGLRQCLQLTPALLTLGGFMLLPMLLVAVISLQQPDRFGGVLWGQWTWESYIRFLFERDLEDQWVFQSDFLAIFARSFGQALLTMLLSLLLGFPLALYIAMQNEKRRQWLLLLITIPFWVNLLVRTFAWLLLLRNGGLIEQALAWLGLAPEQGINVLYTSSAVAVGLVYAYLPFMVLPIYSRLEKMDWRLVEAAYDLGANRRQALRHVILPLAKPGIVAGCVLVFIPTLGAYYIPELLGGGKQMMIGSLVQTQFGVARNWPFGAALAFALLTIVVLGMWLYARYLQAIERESRPVNTEQPLPLQ